MTVDLPSGAGSRPTRRIDLLVVWRAARKHWATALAVALAVTLAVTFYTLGQTRIYRASTTIQIDPNPPRPLGKNVEMVVDVGSGGNYWTNKEYFETQHRIIQSRVTALPVVLQMGLNQDGAFLRNAPPDQKVPPVTVEPERAAEVLRSRVRVDAVRDSRLVVVSYEDANPERAQRIVSAVVASYMDQNLDYAQSSTSAAVVWLSEQLEKLRKELETSETALHKYKRDNNVLSLDPDAQSNMLREEMSALNGELTRVRAKKEDISARSHVLSQVEADPRTMPAPELLASPIIARLREDHEAALQLRAALTGGGKGEEHPEVAGVTQRIGTARAALMAEVQNVKRSVDKELAAVTRQEAGLSRLFEASKRRALNLNMLEVDYNRLRRTRDNNEKLYSLVLDRTKEADLARMVRINNIRVIERALQPGAPVYPRVPVNLAFGVLAGLGLGIAAALSRVLLDRTLKTPDEIEEELGISFLGLLPEIGGGISQGPRYGRRQRRRAAAVAHPELIVHEAPNSGVAEAARAIRTNLLFMSPDEPFRVLLVTSPAPSEGKTTVAASIAIAMAQAGHRVALIDCDLRRPRVHRVFGVSNDDGVTSALLDGRSALATSHPTPAPNLFVVPAGPIPPNPAELFHSERFKVFLKSARDGFDRVIIDSPPVVTVTDAAVLSTQVDGVVLVFRAYKSTRDLARHAVRAVRDVGGKMVGAVLNAVNLERHEYKYHYYYYRRDDYGYRQEQGDAGVEPTSAAQRPD